MTIVSSTRTVSVVAPAGLPAWYANAPENTWIRPPDYDQFSVVFQNNTGQSGSALDATTKWNGGVARDDFYMSIAEGGHDASYENGTYEYGPFSSETPTWNRSIPSSTGLPAVVTAGTWYNTREGGNDDGTIASRHGYWHWCWVPEIPGSSEGRRAFTWCLPAPAAASTGTLSFTHSLQFPNDFAFGAFQDPLSYQTHFPQNISGTGTGGAVFDPVREVVYISGDGSQARTIWSYDIAATKTWTKEFGSLPSGVKIRGLALDPVRRVMTSNYGKAQGDFVVLDADDPSDHVLPPISGPSPEDVNPVYTNRSPNAFYPLNGGKFISYNPEEPDAIFILEVPSDYRNSGDGSLNASSSWVRTKLTIGGSQFPSIEGTTSSNAFNGLYNRFQYIKSIEAFALFLNGNLGFQGVDQGMWVYKPPAGGL